MGRVGWGIKVKRRGEENIFFFCPKILCFGFWEWEGGRRRREMGGRKGRTGGVERKFLSVFFENLVVLVSVDTLG